MSIKSFIRDISPSADEIKQVSISGDIIRNCIQTKIPFICDSLLTGSYKRGTKISPIDDLDIVFEVNACQTNYTRIDYQKNLAIITIPTNNVGNHILKDCTIYSQEYGAYIVSPIKILNNIKTAIKETYSTTHEINRDGECITAYLSSYGFTIDCMPYIGVYGEDYMLIPSGNNSYNWKKTNPKIDEIEINRMNSVDYYYGSFKDVIRIFKYWNIKLNPVKLRSYLIECLAYNYLSGKTQLYRSNHLNILKELVACIYNDRKDWTYDIPRYSTIDYGIDNNQKIKLNNSLSNLYNYLDDEDNLVYFLRQ